MTDYDLSRLSSSSFEDLVQSVATRVLGPGIVVFGDGPDGGRDATFEGKVPFPSEADNWDGYLVVQAKYLKRSRDTHKDGTWARDQLKKELELYTAKDSTRRKPEYFIFATNVVLTSVSSRGSKDRIRALIKEFTPQLGLKGYALWDYDEICNYLETYPRIKDSYSAFVTSSDVLSRVISKLDPSLTDMYDTLTSYLEKEFRSDQFVNLEQAGHRSDEKIPLASVFIDLPTHHDSVPRRAHTLEGTGPHEVVSDTNPTHGFIERILNASSHRLDPGSWDTSVVADSLDPRHKSEARGRFVLIGGPGQGKTTLTQFICQIFRAAIIDRKSARQVSAGTRPAIAALQRYCEKESIDHRVVPRFPFKITLSDFANSLSHDSSAPTLSVLSYVATQITKRSVSEISPSNLLRFLSEYPSVIIFDGLDEVPASSNRDQVLDAIRDFWIDVSNVDADILSIATSRPQGYHDDFSPSRYQHLRLIQLSESLGWHFIERLVEVRYGSDEVRKQKIRSRLRRALRDDSTSRLMRSPLQITIMTALVDRMGTPPQVQWELFDSYYNVIYEREEERDIPASVILRDYRPDIKAIHNQVGLVLQIESERTGRTDARLSYERFRSLVEARLHAEGYMGSALDVLTQHIVTAAADRLVFLVGVEADQVGFEVRSLQEFMAAESLMEATDQVIAKRLKEIAPIPFWRNVFLFATGKCFTARQALRDNILRICGELNERDGDHLSHAYLAGSDLAIAMLEDGSARRQPRYCALLARIAIRALDTPNTQLHLQLADVYDPQLEETYQEELSLRLSGVDHIRTIAAWNCILRLIENGVFWAPTLASDYWPLSQGKQLGILKAISVPTKNSWSGAKLLDIIPYVAVDEFSRQLQFTDARWVEDHDVSSVVKAAALSITMHDRQVHREVNVQGTEVYYGPVVPLLGGENSQLHSFQSIQGWHPSWLVYKYAVPFAKSPSKQSLTKALYAIASVYDPASFEFSRHSWRLLPWPIVACLRSCTTVSELRDLARRISQGVLGDREEWEAAEARWFSEGIGDQDLASMTDDRLPFDARMKDVGFPVALDSLAAISFFTLEESRSEEFLRRLNTHVERWHEVSVGPTRSYMATTINWLLFAYLFDIGRRPAPHLPAIDVKKLLTAYEDLPLSMPIPLHILVVLGKESDTDLIGFFRSVVHRDLFLGFSPSQFIEPSVNTLAALFKRNRGETSLLHILALVAEQGQLETTTVLIERAELDSEPSGQLAGLLITLAQETWRVDTSEEFIAWASSVVAASTDGFAKIVTTLENGRLSGTYLDRFVVGLGVLRPPHDYGLNERYNGLLEQLMRRRTSRFIGSDYQEHFKIPEGVRALLAVDGGASRS